MEKVIDVQITRDRNVRIKGELYKLKKGEIYRLPYNTGFRFVNKESFAKYTGEGSYMIDESKMDVVKELTAKDEESDEESDEEDKDEE